MKKIINLILAISIFMSLCIFPAGAAVSTTTKVGMLDVDSLNVENETDLFTETEWNLSSDYNGYWSKFGTNGYPLRIYSNQYKVGSTTTPTTYLKVNGDKTDNQNVKVTFTDETVQNDVHIVFLDINRHTYTTEKAYKNANPSFSIRMKLPEGMMWGVQYNSSTTDKGNRGACSLITSDTLGNVTIYDSGLTGHIKYEIWEPEQWFELKVIFDSTAKTADVYINNRCVKANIKIDYEYVFHIDTYIKETTSNTNITAPAYFDDAAFYTVADADIKVQPNVSKSGNGTVAVAMDDATGVTGNTVAVADENITYTVTPDKDSYIEEVTYGGAPISTFSADTFTYTTRAAADKKFEVKFADYEAEMPSVAVSPFKVQTSEASYVFCRLFDNGVTPDEFGILLSTNEEPTLEEAVPFDANNTMNNLGVNDYGYFGYEIINQTDATTYYVKPYAKKDDAYTYGDVETIDLETLTRLD